MMPGLRQIDERVERGRDWVVTGCRQLAKREAYLGTRAKRVRRDSALVRRNGAGIRTPTVIRHDRTADSAIAAAAGTDSAVLKGPPYDRFR
jgi:hypothetical protein